MKEDKQIWENFKNEEDDALSYIYHENIDFLFCYGRKFSKDDYLILDVIQDLFYDLIRNRKKLGETDHIRLYLVKSFRRKLIRELERTKKQSLVNASREIEADIVFSVEEELIQDESQNRKLQFIREGMQKLNAQQREILYYKFTCCFEYEQICEIMSISYDSARQLVSRAIQSLKKKLGNTDVYFMFIFKGFKS